MKLLHELYAGAFALTYFSLCEGFQNAILEGFLYRNSGFNIQCYRHVPIRGIMPVCMPILKVLNQ